jgi:hypothetical protein
MDHAVTADTTAVPWTRVLLVSVIASLACAPISWIVDGVTPSMIVYPIVLLVGLWRRSRGAGTLYFGIAATIFLLIHLPFTWASVTGAATNPANHTQPSHPVEWLIILFLVPLATAIVGFGCWRRQRH